MDRIWDGLTKVAHKAILAGCALLFFGAVVVTAEVMVRKAIPDLIQLTAWIAGKFSVNLTAWADSTATWVKNNWGFSGSDEMSGYLFAIGTSWSMSYVLISRGHVRIDVLYATFSPRVRAILDVLALLALAIFVGALVERAFNVTSINFIEHNRSNSNLRFPLAWPQIPWFLGILLFFFTIVMAILRSLSFLFKGDFAGVASTAGVSSQDEEIESELKGLGIQAPHAGKN